MVGTIGGLDSHHNFRLDRGQLDRALGRSSPFTNRKSARRLSGTGAGEPSGKGYPRRLWGSDRGGWRVAGSSIQAEQDAWPESRFPMASGCGGGRLSGSSGSRDFMGSGTDWFAALDTTCHYLIFVREAK